MSTLTERSQRGQKGQRFSSTNNAPSHIASLDQALVWVTVALLAWGLVMVYSASIAMPQNPKFERYTHTHFLIRHMVSLAVAFVAALIAFQTPVATWEKVAPWLFVVSLLLLVVVLIPHVGKGVNGAKRWIPLGITGFCLPRPREKTGGHTKSIE